MTQYCDSCNVLKLHISLDQLLTSTHGCLAALDDTRLVPLLLRRWGQKCESEEMLPASALGCEAD